MTYIIPPNWMARAHKTLHTYGNWTEEEIEKLKTMYAEYPDQVAGIARRLNKTKNQTLGMLEKLGHAKEPARKASAPKDYSGTRKETP
jgi:hypothetical protein